VTRDDALLHHFSITHVLDCLADPAKNRVVAGFSNDVSCVFPYLNAMLPNAMYNHAAQILTVRRGQRILTFYPHVAVMTKVAGQEDAQAQLEWFQELCNDAWRRRQEVVPCYERGLALGPLDLYRLLPKLNCGACGEVTCMAFAFKLLLREQRLCGCPRLDEQPYAEQGRRLEELLGTRHKAVHRT